MGPSQAQSVTTDVTPEEELNIRGSGMGRQDNLGYQGHAARAG